MDTSVVIVLVGTSCPGSVHSTDTIQSSLLSLLPKNLHVFYSLLEYFGKYHVHVHQESDEIKNIIVIFNEPPADIPTSDLQQLYIHLMDLCVRKRQRIVRIVKNFKGKVTQSTWLMARRAKRMLHVVHDLETKSSDQLATNLCHQINDKDSFSSPGESFAWQLVVGFLSYILPCFQACVRSSILDDEGFMRSEILHEHGFPEVDPKKVRVLPRYFLLLSEQVACGEQSVAMTPSELFPGCKKLSKASSDFCLEFDSPGYKKRIPAYLMELDQTLTKDDAVISHVLIFSGYAAPTFIMQKLDMSSEDKRTMFQQFKDELQFILNHSKASEILLQFSDSRSTEVTGLESSAVQLIDVTDHSSLKSTLSQEAHSYLLSESSHLQAKSSQLQQPADEAEMDGLPLMSMAFAMAANCWIGFSQLLLSHIQNLIREGEQLPFTLPYSFVIPKSGRFPDEAKLLKRFAEIGVRSEQVQFQSAGGGRRYTFRVHEWRSRRIAFEIPPCVLGIRRQAECGVGGVRSGDVGAHLAEFRNALAGFTAASDGSFRVMDWDDDDLDELAWTEPNNELALSLLKCLGA